PPYALKSPLQASTCALWIPSFSFYVIVFLGMISVEEPLAKPNQAVSWAAPLGARRPNPLRRNGCFQKNIFRFSRIEPLNIEGLTDKFIGLHDPFQLSHQPSKSSLCPESRRAVRSRPAQRGADIAWSCRMSTVRIRVISLTCLFLVAAHAVWCFFVPSQVR
ncbi:MAG: hypothetical protein OET79_12010, partial [Nitrospirota bacterium]|nr:hypothetical protein [Nitrospirota bacterium]